MKSNDEIIKTLEDLRAKENGMSISELARRVGMAKSAVSRYFNGTREFPLNKADDFAAVLHTTTEELLGLVPSLPAHSYPYLDAGVACGAPELIEGYTNNDLQEIQLSDAVMGPYAGDKDILVLHANGESMNRVFPDGALLAVQRTENLQDGDIVVFSVDGQDYSCKRYYNNRDAQIVSFQPDSDDRSFSPYVYRYEDADNVSIFGKVVVYTVIL